MSTENKEAEKAKIRTTLMFVDDEPDILEILKQYAKGLADEIYAISNPLDAIEFAKTHTINLAVLDLKMPGMDGITLLRELTKIQPNMKSMILTAHGEKDDVQSSMRLHASDFLDKPVDLHIFRSRIQAVLQEQASEKLQKGALGVVRMMIERKNLSSGDK